MQTWQRDDILPLLLHCGKLALDVYEDPNRTVKGDGSLVTEADQAIESYLEEHLDHPEAGIYLLGEETVATRSEHYLEQALQQTAYVVDPIDGTACYAHHVPLWGISIGYMREGVLQEGAVYLPLTREIFATQGDTVYLGHVNGDDVTWQVIEPYHADFLPTGLIALTQDLAKGGAIALANPVHVLACAVVPLTYLLLGRYEAYLGHLKVWDLAGALPMLLKLGFEAQFLGGRKLDGSVHADYYNLRLQDPRCWKLWQPCLFARPGIAEHVLPHLRLQNSPLAIRQRSTS